jgi:predicted nuclease of predicted toxin-antitoxin system
MKIKLDENLPARLVAVLEKRGHEVDTVATEGLTGMPDPQVWDAVRREGRFFITQDLDFSDIRQFRPGTHAGLLLIRLREPGGNALLERVAAADEAHRLESWSGCFVVLTDRKLRVKRP